MATLHEKYGDKIEFIGVNVGVNERLERVEKFVKKKELKMKIFFDEKKTIVKLFKAIGTPTSIIIDKKGVIKYMKLFSPKNFEEVLKELE